MYIKLCAYSDISSLCTGTLTARTYVYFFVYLFTVMHRRRLYTSVGLQYSPTGSETQDNSWTGLHTAYIHRIENMQIIIIGMFNNMYFYCFNHN